MSTFSSIEDKLNEFAKKYNTQVREREIGFDRISTKETELRKIFWADGIFLKGIFILPVEVVNKGSDLTMWDFTIHASFNEYHPGEVPFWEKALLEGVPFPEIEKQIDNLLSESEKYLAAVRVEDMRIGWEQTNWTEGRPDEI
jgi:hypothetical protein